MKKLIGGIIGLCVIVLIVFFFTREDSGNPFVYNDLVQVDAPQVGQVVKSPLLVKGLARGSWYFEASFPILLVDANGAELAVAPATALSEWMTTDYVPFEASLTFGTPTTTNGELILRKDNPSGLPENDDEVRLPVRFFDESSKALFNESLTLRVGESAVFEDGLITTVKAIEDSRCPVGATCVWQGELAAVLQLSGGSLAGAQEARLGSVQQSAVSLAIAPYSLSLVSLDEAELVLRVDVE